MLQIKVIGVSYFILGFYLIAKVGCQKFDISQARELVNDVFDYIEQMFSDDEELELTGYKSEMNKATSADDLPGIADGILTENQLENLENMYEGNRNGLITKINEFIPKYNKLLTDSGNDSKEVPFRTLRQALIDAGKEKIE